MGHELYRMIRDGAPLSWTTAMRVVALMIADAADDPSQLDVPDDSGMPSAIPVRGFHTPTGGWWDGIIERTGLSGRHISRALADLAKAGYEMREQVIDRTGRPMFDTRGRPVFAYPGRAMRFRVPLLAPRECPPYTATMSPPYTASTTASAVVAKSGSEGRHNRHRRSPEMATPSPQSPVPISSSSSPQRFPGTARASRQGDDDDSETRPGRPGPGYGWCPACREWFGVVSFGVLAAHGPVIQRCPGSGREPAEPVRCARCGKTGVAVTGFEGLCQVCRRKSSSRAGLP